MTSSSLTQADGGTLEVHTGVTGKASKMGHRLTLAMTSWSVTIGLGGGRLDSVLATIEVGSLEVVSGEGGITPLIGPEKIVAKSNAVRTLQADKFPQITYTTTSVEEVPDGYRLTGTLEIHGKSREHVIDLTVDDAGRASFDTVVTQTDFGVKPYSQLMGAMKVVDDVTVSFRADVHGIR